MVGAFVISLDFELMWGVRDHRTPEAYGDAVLGGRAAIPEMLARFERAGIRATWATVGLLFARNRDEMLDYAPSIRPTYRDANLSPYTAIERSIGRNETEDKLHFGRSLVERIMNTRGQEIATHTFSHYYCLEDGQDTTQFDADLAAAAAIAARDRITFKSIVFPRNQMSDRHVAICGHHGIPVWRGNPGGLLYRSRPKSGQSHIVRGGRFVDSFLPIAGRLSFPQPQTEVGAVNVPASRFLRPWSQWSTTLSCLQTRRITDEMTYAARREEIYHLWWHPHNFGRHVDRNLARLDIIIDKFKALSDRLGMESLSMADVAMRCDFTENLLQNK